MEYDFATRTLTGPESVTREGMLAYMKHNFEDDFERLDVTEVVEGGLRKLTFNIPAGMEDVW